MAVRVVIQARHDVLSPLGASLTEEIDDTLTNWGRWCRDGWPGPLYAQPPTSRDYRAPNQEGKRHRAHVIDVVSAEIATLAIVNLALAGDTRSYQIISAWWAHRWPAKRIMRHLHCSLPSVYRYRLHAMQQFWPEYQREAEKTRPKKNI